MTSDDDDKFYIVLFREARWDSESWNSSGGRGAYGYTPWAIFRGYSSIGSARSIVTRRHSLNKVIQGKVVVCRPSECLEVTDDLQAQFNDAEKVAESAATRAGEIERRLKAGEAIETPVARKVRRRRKAVRS